MPSPHLRLACRKQTPFSTFSVQAAVQSHHWEFGFHLQNFLNYKSKLLRKFSKADFNQAKLDLKVYIMKH
ncbi:uncharacterized protein IAS62_004684 [Cryptococcus decagattii]|uniref:Uncharacterized protein n=1 Tax=Cryptococcus decagattii TaxID=1859122 RepID=A0ABZ2AY21_9TREE